MSITTGWLPLFLVLAPFGGAILVAATGSRHERARDGCVLLTVAGELLGTASLIRPVVATERVANTVPWVLGHLELIVDPFGATFALIVAFVWFCATLYSFDYLVADPARNRYHAASLTTLGATMGVVLAGNLMTLFLFFELLGMIAYLLVVHTGTDDARRASLTYFWMTVSAGVVLLAGIFLTYALGGTGTIGPLPDRAGSDAIRWTAFACLILGFGVKAGMLPVHVWLPDAHSAAPSPASALLSGVMIKAGAYGIFRTVTALFRPPLETGMVTDVGREPWLAFSDMGLVVLWMGLATMAVGIVLALGQRHVKRALAYSSVSQMGFILAGVGTAGYLGPHGAQGLAGGLFYLTSHALFKAALFLGIGAVIFRTGEHDLYRLGALWRRMPLVFAFTLTAAAGIVGIPLFNGFVGKCLIHHALVQAHETSGLASFVVAEKIYIVSCAGTAALLIKIVGLVFLRRTARPWGPEIVDAPPRMLGAMALLAAPIVVLGVRPQLLLKGLLVPGMQAWALPPTGVTDYLDHDFLRTPDLLTSAAALGLGAVIFLVGARFRLFDMHLPRWMGVDVWYRKAATVLLATSSRLGHTYDALRGAPAAAFVASRNRLAIVWRRAAAGVAHERSVLGRQMGRVRRRSARVIEHLRPPPSVAEGFDAHGAAAATRLRILRYARDMSFNIALIFVVMLSFLVAIAIDLGR